MESARGGHSNPSSSARSSTKGSPPAAAERPAAPPLDRIQLQHLVRATVCDPQITGIEDDTVRITECRLGGYRQEKTYGIATERMDSDVVPPSLPVTSRRMLTSVVLGV
jgi:hypothetical protein